MCCRAAARCAHTHGAPPRRERGGGPRRAPSPPRPRRVSLKAFSKFEDTAEALNLLAVNLDGRACFRGSEPLFIHSLRLRRRLLGLAHPEVASSYNNIANLKRKTCREEFNKKESKAVAERKRAERALVLALYRRAVEIREEKLGRNSPQLAATITNLSVQLARGDEDDIKERGPPDRPGGFTTPDFATDEADRRGTGAGAAASRAASPAAPSTKALAGRRLSCSTSCSTSRAIL